MRNQTAYHIDNTFKLNQGKESDNSNNKTLETITQVHTTPFAMAHQQFSQVQIISFSTEQIVC